MVFSYHFFWKFQNSFNKVNMITKIAENSAFRFINFYLLNFLLKIWIKVKTVDIYFQYLCSLLKINDITSKRFIYFNFLLNYHRLKLLISTFIKVGAAQGQMKKNWNKEDWIMSFLQVKRAWLTKDLHLKTPTSDTRGKYINILMKNTNPFISKSELSIIWFQQWCFFINYD